MTLVLTIYRFIMIDSHRGEQQYLESALIQRRPRQFSMEKAKFTLGFDTENISFILHLAGVNRPKS